MTEYAGGYILFFEDHPPEGQVLIVGTREECLKTLNLLPAVLYNGPHTVKECRQFTRPNDLDPPLLAGTKLIFDSE